MITLKARAKINLGLSILGRRSDGFHDIQSVFQEISLCDILSISIKPGNSVISLSCSDSEIPSDSSNLAWKAAEAFLSSTGEALDVSIELEKNIPSRAGLGGGSSDAAAVLKGLSQLTGISDIDLNEIARTLGSDVPFFITGGAAFIEGRGELISEIPAVPFHAVLIHPKVRISTPWAYSAWDRDMSTSLTINTMIRHYSPSSAVWHEGKPFPHNLRNDFLPLLEKHYPEIAELAKFMTETKCENWGLSGSGPTFYALFRSKSGVRSFSRILHRDFTLCRSAETAGASSNG
ncbi:4-(cytidine 5'-diphospho)-2-C-methyl-D-erythritol kinase [Candidatus Fermentibacteria bacterium]|nr:MAG: 4-(cytidine 5'-diphospho)-2-C-methyl-D-erythritol kinase [Candidatus Fermentibacteria bacterium]